jgi:hypothetical protein
MFTCPGYVDDDAQTDYTHSNSTYAAVNGGVGSRLSFVADGEKSVELRARLAASHSAVAAFWSVGIGIDSTTEAHQSAFQSAPSVAADVENVEVTYDDVPAAGRHTADLTVMTDQATLTVIADDARRGAAADPPVTYLEGRVAV